MAVIPARGGSKRIPRKNVRAFAGKPMIVHSIECAHRSGLFDRVVVTTDDNEIAQIARGAGAEVPFMRPATLADDYVGTVAVIAHAVDWLHNHGLRAASICCIYATAPFMRTDDLQKGLELLETGKWQYVFAATSFASPVFRAFRKDTGGGLEMLFPGHFYTRSQDLPEVLHDAAQFYWASASVWLAKTLIFDSHSTVVTIPRWRVQDIDTEEDWVRAESMASHLGLLDSAGARSAM